MDTFDFYLFASPAGALDESSAKVFYKVKGDSLAVSLCRLFNKEYSDTNGRPTFHHKAAASISTEAQILLDEALDWLNVYDDPDPGIYDPPPPKDVLLLAQYAVRAKKWEELLVERIESCDQNITPDNIDSSSKNSPKTDEIPKMTSEERRNSALILLMLLAQAYYKMLECTISMASWCAALDLELNQSYLWTVESITNLLKNREDLKDFPIQFEPLFSDLYPSTVRDVDWQEMVAPDAERFLSAVQRYIQSKEVYEPVEGSPAWVFIELFRPGVNTAIERALAYNKRMRQYYQRIMNSPPHEAPRMQPTWDDPEVRNEHSGMDSETKMERNEVASNEQIGFRGGNAKMSPEEPGNLVVVDLKFQNGQLVCTGERINSQYDRLTVSWYSLEQPKDSLGICEGVAYVYDMPGIQRREIRDARPRNINSHYVWRDVARGDGLMFILIIPLGYTITDPEPVPVEAKNFNNRLALFWMPDGKFGTSVEIEWALKEFQGDMDSEVKRINNDIRSSKKVSTHGGVSLRYDVALSFAGEDREYVEKVASILKERRVRVFYDKYEAVYLWGKDLYVHLAEIYQKQAKYTVMFISKHYAKKLWTNRERESAQARAFGENREYILPARFDETEVPGMLPTIGYISLKETQPHELADMIVQKLGL